MTDMVVKEGCHIVKDT